MAEPSLSPETEGLTVRVTTTGFVVVEGPCPNCRHAAQEHWSSGCKGNAFDHCRMDTQKLARLALCLQESGCDGHSHSLLCNNAYFAAVHPPRNRPADTDGSPS
jgi:hypothetical protein